VCEQAVTSRQESVRDACYEADIPVADKKKGRPTGAIKKRTAPQIPAEEAEATRRVTRAAAKVLTFS
jgi:hypothetical protein